DVSFGSVSLDSSPSSARASRENEGTSEDRGTEPSSHAGRNRPGASPCRPVREDVRSSRRRPQGTTARGAPETHSARLLPVRDTPVSRRPTRRAPGNDRSPYTTELPLPARPNRRSARRRVLSPRCAGPLRSGAEQEDDGSPGTRDAPGSHRRSGALESFGRAEP